VPFRGPMRHVGADGEVVRPLDEEARFWLTQVGVHDGFASSFGASSTSRRAGSKTTPTFVRCGRPGT
jgi:hypothetical protein